MTALLHLAEKYADATGPLRAIQNAAGILELRLSDDEWARGQGERLAPGFTTSQIVAGLMQAAVQLYGVVTEADAESLSPNGSSNGS